MDRRNFLKSLFALAVALPVAPILSVAWVNKIITVSPGGGISLQEAIAAAKPGDTIYLDPGVYDYRGTLVIKDGISIDGGSYSEATININDPDTCLVYMDGEGILSNVTITSHSTTGITGLRLG